MSNHIFHRRSFLKQTTLTATVASISKFDVARLCASSHADQRQSFSFFHIGDTHYLANIENPSEIDARSSAVCSKLIDTLNQLPGSSIPETAGSGKVMKPLGVIHAGDIIDSGDKRGLNFEKMQQTEFDAFNKEFGIDGTDGRLQFPVFEVYGNHDSPSGSGFAIDGLKERNKKRKNVTLSHNQLHLAWDWGPVRCINLGIVVGQDKSNSQRRRYHPMDSLEFLIEDLKQHASDGKRPVLLTHHIDVVRYSKPCELNNNANLSMEWNPCDVRAYYEAIRSYNVIGILYGHTHVRNILRWDGGSNRVEQGIPLLNVDNSSHFHGGNQAFFYIEVTPDEMIIRECATKDAWTTYQWTPTVWRHSILPKQESR
jgi:predicted phosphodiesterase